GKTPAARPFVVLCIFAHMFFPALSPDCVHNRITALPTADSARRSRPTERSEAVSEEAEYILYHIFC
ncbi:hypothetical protein, partial [Escherichia coli]|uniref:hypothetical protein n=1 Tax=Escherichia coli TaxID=562 RepID=UPI002FBE579E